MVLTSDQNPGLLMVLNTAWWLIGLSLVFRSNTGIFTAIVTVCGLWLLGCFLTVRRIIFVIENQGMERADGLGTPAYFLIGLIFEQCFLFVPMSILLVLGVATVWTRRS